MTKVRVSFTFHSFVVSSAVSDFSLFLEDSYEETILLCCSSWIKRDSPCPLVISIIGGGACGSGAELCPLVEPSEYDTGRVERFIRFRLSFTAPPSLSHSSEGLILTIQFFRKQKKTENSISILTVVKVLLLHVLWRGQPLCRRGRGLGGLLALLTARKNFYSWFSLFSATKLEYILYISLEE